MRIFPDTNVLLSAFFGNGLCSELMERLLESDHTLIIGEPAAREFVRIAKEKFKVTPASLAYALEVLRRLQPAPAAAELPEGIPDPDDGPVIACALAAGAGIFITGDKALFKLDGVQGMGIVSPREFLRQFGARL